jgi:hypothetical protein
MPGSAISGYNINTTFGGGICWSAEVGLFIMTRSRPSIPAYAILSSSDGINWTSRTSNTTGAVLLSGGIGISLTTDATSATNGGTFTSATGSLVITGGLGVSGNIYLGGTLNVGPYKKNF